MADEGNYEVKDPEIQAILRRIGARIGDALKDGWGFLLMLYEYGSEAHPGANFYISKASRADSIKMLKEWIARQEGKPPGHEWNPGHPTTKSLHDNWHKVAAILLYDQPGRRLVMTKAMLERFAENADNISIAAKEQDDGLHLWLVDGAEAQRLAREEGATV